MAFDFGILLPILFAVGYWAIGYLQTVIGKSGEAFDLQKTLRTLGAGIVVAVLQGLAGIAIAPGDVTTWAAFIALLVVAVNKVLNLYATTGTTPAAAAAAPGSPAAVPVPAAPVPGRNESVPTAKIDTDRKLPLSVALYPPACEDYGPIQVTFAIDANPRTGLDAAARYVLNFGDGSPIIEGELMYGQAFVKHTYDWKFDGKYSGKTFYPSVTVIGLQGNTVNTAANDRMESFITVHDKIHEQALGIPLRRIVPGTAPSPI